MLRHHDRTKLKSGTDAVSTAKINRVFSKFHQVSPRVTSLDDIGSKPQQYVIQPGATSGSLIKSYCNSAGRLLVHPLQICLVNVLSPCLPTSSEPLEIQNIVRCRDRRVDNDGQTRARVATTVPIAAAVADSSNSGPVMPIQCNLAQLTVPVKSPVASEPMSTKQRQCHCKYGFPEYFDMRMYI